MWPGPPYDKKSFFIPRSFYYQMLSKSYVSPPLKYHHQTTLIEKKSIFLFVSYSDICLL